MDREDIYYSINNEAHCEIKEKGSRFVGYITPVKSEAAAADAITSIQKKHHSATHHCTAYITGIQQKKRISRFNDDGEPSGTAGRPILNALERDNLVNVLCVVTRYFGGIKLGTGGLARAYGKAAAFTVRSAGIEKRYIRERLGVTFEYELTGTIMGLVNKMNLTVSDSDYSDKTRLLLSVRASRFEKVSAALTEATGGRIELEKAED